VKVRPVGPRVGSCGRTDRRADIHDEFNRRFFFRHIAKVPNTNSIVMGSDEWDELEVAASRNVRD
jgi:hypothetical protein